MKKAFTLIELIAVMVIVGILSLMGVEVALNIYRGYLHSRAINTLEAQTEIVLEQISKRLSFRVKESTIGKQANGTTFISTKDPLLNNTYPILEWISYNYETFQNGEWSGFVDLSDGNTTRVAGNAGTLQTTTSTLSNAMSQTLGDLTRGAVTTNNSQLGILFLGTPLNVANSFGYDRAAPTSVGVVTGANAANSILNITYPAGAEISEQYLLLHTAYAVVPTDENGNIKQAGAGDSDFDLVLHYNYRPWTNVQFNNQNASRSVLARNVTRFNFTELDGMIVMKLCMRDGGRSLGGGDLETTVCKTKAVY